MSKSTLNSTRRYSERVSAPQSEADWQLAFRDPNSPISKLIDNIVADKNIAAEERLYVLMDRMQVQRHEELKEKEAFFLANLQGEVKKRTQANDERIQYLKDAAIPPPKDSPKREETIKNYMNYVTSLNNHISHLTQESKKLDEHVKVIEKSEKTLSDKWVTRETAGFDAVVKDLAAKSITGLKTSTGDVIAFTDPEVRKAFIPPPPPMLMKINPALATAAVAPKTMVFQKDFVSELNAHGLVRRREMQAKGLDPDAVNLKVAEIKIIYMNNQDVFKAIQDYAKENLGQHVLDFTEAKALTAQKIKAYDQKDVIHKEINQSVENVNRALVKLSAMGVNTDNLSPYTKSQTPAEQPAAQAARPDWPPRPTPRGTSR